MFRRAALEVDEAMAETDLGAMPENQAGVLRERSKAIRDIIVRVAATYGVTIAPQPVRGAH